MFLNVVEKNVCYRLYGLPWTYNNNPKQTNLYCLKNFYILSHYILSHPQIFQ